MKTVQTPSRPTTDGSVAGSSRAVFYGWYVVAGAFMVMLIGFGTAYTIGAFFQSLQREFSASRADVALILCWVLSAVHWPIATDRAG